MTIIGLTGYAGSGKDTVGAMLVEHEGFTRVSFADRVRELAYHLDPLLVGPIRHPATGLEMTGVQAVGLQTLVDTWGWESAKRGSTEVRQLLQRLGEGARTVLGDHVWIDATMHEVESIAALGRLSNYRHTGHVVRC